jgi:hypothetical protein
MRSLFHWAAISHRSPYDEFSAPLDHPLSIGSFHGSLPKSHPPARRPLRPDAVHYCLDALQRFRDLGEAQTKTITFEIAMLGREGFDINSPEKKYSLKSQPGHFSGLQLVSLMYVGMKFPAPEADVGIDLSKEYALAKARFELGK